MSRFLHRRAQSIPYTRMVRVVPGRFTLFRVGALCHEVVGIAMHDDCMLYQLSGGKVSMQGVSLILWKNVRLLLWECSPII